MRILKPNTSITWRVGGGGGYNQSAGAYSYPVPTNSLPTITMRGNRKNVLGDETKWRFSQTFGDFFANMGSYILPFFLY